MQGEIRSFMLKRRLSVVVFIVVAVSFGIPSQVSAAPSIPRSLTAVRTVLSQVEPGQSKTLSVRMPWRANMVGVSYVDASHSENGVTVEARAHTAAGWSAWEALGANDTGATGVEAKHDSQRLSTEALWVGTADHVEVSISVASTGQEIQDVRVHLINTLGDSKPQNIVVRALHAIGAFLSMHAAPAAAPAQAQTVQPTIISRAQWGANPAYLNLPCPGIAPDLKMAFVHHTDTTNSYTKSQSAGIVRGIYAYHTNSLGYCDIAYNFLIDKYGQIFEGRSGGITQNVIGAHTGGYNYGTVGVALLGQYSEAKPSSAMLTALVQLLAWRLDIAHVPAIGQVSMTVGTGNDHTAPGTVVKLNRISGHRDASNTNCPGNNVYSLMSWIRSHVAATGTPKIYLPSLSANVIRPGSGGVDNSATFASTFSQSVGWTFKLISSSGSTVRQFTGTGSSVALTVDGSDANGGLLPNGDYGWRLDAADSTGHSATPATGSLTILRPDNIFSGDVTGSGLRSLVYFGPDFVHVQLSDGSSYGSDSSWTGGPYYGKLGDALADVTGDGKADAIVVNPTSITVRRSDGTKFLPNETWSTTPFYGTKGTYFADVNGDGKADAIRSDSNGITVRLSDGTKFLPPQTWSTNPYYGSKGTYFADVTGDGKADAIVVNDTSITVRRSDGTKFLANETWSTIPFFGSRGTYFADVNGDGKADAIRVDTDAITVRPSDATQFTPNEAWYSGAAL